MACAGIAEAGEMNAYRALAIIGAVGLALRILGILPAWSLAIAPSPTSRPACGAASR